MDIQGQNINGMFRFPDEITLLGRNKKELEKALNGIKKKRSKRKNWE